jgi:hypothetical protein
MTISLDDPSEPHALDLLTAEFVVPNDGLVELARNVNGVFSAFAWGFAVSDGVTPTEKRQKQRWYFKNSIHQGKLAIGADILWRAPTDPNWIAVDSLDEFKDKVIERWPLDSSPVYGRANCVQVLKQVGQPVPAIPEPPAPWPPPAKPLQNDNPTALILRHADLVLHGLTRMKLVVDGRREIWILYPSYQHPLQESNRVQGSGAVSAQLELPADRVEAAFAVYDANLPARDFM